MVRIKNKKMSLLGIILVFIFVWVYSSNFGDTKRQDELRNHIPNIKIEGSDATMKNELMVLSRTSDSVIATKKIVMKAPPSKIRGYYQKELIQGGWIVKDIKKIYNKSDVYYADAFLFEKDGYLLSIMIQKPRDDIKESEMNEEYFNVNKLSYTITVKKIDKI